jgi:hypothetical protein
MSQSIDFSRSFLTFRIDTLKKPPQTVSHAPPYSLNNARIQLDCICELKQPAENRSQTFVLGVSCKTERVGVPRDIWTTPNSDFIPVVSAQRFLNIKTYAFIGHEAGVELHGLGRPQPDRQTGETALAFDRLTIHLQPAPAQELPTPREIIEATYQHRPLVAVTEYRDGPRTVRLTYPIKTFNVNERDDIYQTDTGPLLIPRGDAPFEQQIEGLQLAFGAFNSPDFIELLMRAPTPVPGGARVYHYSEPLRLDGVRNRIYALT